MPRDANGSTSPLPGIIVQTGDTVLPSQHNPFVNDVYAMMEQSLSRDGQGGMRAAMNMNGYPIRNVGPATQPNDAISMSQFQSGMPVGAVIDFAGDAAPQAWMFCYGQAISRTAYPEAFAACGTKFGNGNGTTTFNLPDYRGRVGVGKDDMGGSDSGRMSFFGAIAKTIGSVFGSASHVLTVGQMPSHNHGGNTGGGGAHSHTVEIRGMSDSDHANNVTRGANGTSRTGTYTTSTAPNHTHPIPSQGNDEAHTNTQPSIVINKIIKVSY